MAKTPKKNKAAPKKRYAAHNFLFLSLGVSWMMAAGLYLGEQPLSSLAGFLVATIYIFVPAGVTLLVYNKTLMDRVDLALHPNRGFLLAILVPISLGALSLWISTLMGETQFSWELADVFDRMALNVPEDQRPKIVEGQLHPFWAASIQSLVAGVSINAFFALGEELGWRGLLLNEWIKEGFWGLSLRTGMAWGLWWAPLVYLGQQYPGYPTEGVAMILIWAVLASPLITWVRILARSVAAAALMRGLLMAVSGLSIMPLQGGNVLTSGLMGQAGLLALLLANLALFVGLKVKPLVLPPQR